MDIQRYYEILELTPGASSEDVALAYRDLVNVWHPDRFSKIPRLRRKAEKKLKEVNKAYERLQSYFSELEQAKCEHKEQTGAYRNVIPPEATDEKPKKVSLNFSRTYSWARCLARFIDYLLFALVLGSLNVYGILLKLDIPMPLFPIISTFIWVFVEAALVTFFGKSPGKWLLKTTIIDKSLEKPGYFGALRRSLSVWCNGMGTGIFFVAPVTMAISYKRLKKEGYAPWDREGRFYLIHEKIGAPRFLSAFLFFFIFSGLNIHEMHEQMELMQVVRKASKSTDEMGGQREKTSTAQDTAAQENQLQATSDYADAQYQLGKSCYELGRYEEAIKALKQVVRIRPDFAEAQYGLGISYANMRLYNEATNTLMRAIRIKPDYAEAHHILGYVYLNIGNKKAAIRQYQILQGLDEGLAKELLAYIGIAPPGQ